MLYNGEKKWTAPEELKKEIETVVRLLKTEKPAELTLFINWFKHMFEDKKELVEEVKGLVEVKTMLRTSIKKLKEDAIKDGLQKGLEKGLEKGLLEGIKKGEHQKAIQTARALLKEKMTVEKISEITGISVKEIKKLIE